MKSVYKVLSYLIAVGVVVQAMLIVFAIAGLFKWIDGGGELDKAVEVDRAPFPEAVGLNLHAIAGVIVIPAIALLLLICSFFAKIPGGIKWAGLVLLFVVVQDILGFSGLAAPALGAAHGLNALLLFSAAIYTAGWVGRRAASPVAEPQERVATSA
jgi:hypothetical protein